MNILYVHGFRSSGNAGTAERLRRLLPESRVVSPDLPTDAHEALALLKHIVREEKIDVVVGTSMGGMLAQKLRGVPKVIVNPSFFVSKTFSRNMGRVSYFSKREDGATEFEITPATVSGYEDIERNQFEGLTQEEKDITIGAFGNRDEEVDCKDMFLRHYDNAVSFDGGHRLDEEAVRRCIVPAILKLLGKRESSRN